MTESQTGHQESDETISHEFLSRNTALSAEAARILSGPATAESVEQKLLQQAPPHLAAMESIANGYKDYMKYLKNGGDSGIDRIFGRLELFDSRISH